MGIKRIVWYKDKEELYSPSRTELLLEDICTSFNTELLSAHIDWTGGWPLLYRLSKPIKFYNKKDSRKRSVHFQYAKFFPFWYVDDEHLTKVYGRNRRVSDKERSRENIKDIIFGEIEKKFKGKLEENFMNLLFDTHLVDRFAIKRYPKEIYVAIYEGDIKEEENTPALKINRIEDYSNINLLPEVYIKYQRNPIFFLGNIVEEDIKDEILISYPRTPMEDYNLKKALSLHPIKIGTHSMPNRYRTLILPSNTSVNQDDRVMGLIQAYVRNICLDRTL